MIDLILTSLLSVLISTVIGGYFTLYNQHKGKVIDKIWDERYRVYCIIWEISKFVPKYPSLKTITYTQLKTISESLRKWYFEENGGILLTEKSKSAYINLQEMLNSILKDSDEKISIDGENSEYSRIQNLFSKLRTELTSDLMSRKRGINFLD